MATRLLFGSEAQAALRHLHPTTKKRGRAALNGLKVAWPRPQDLDIKRLRSDTPRPPVYRLRVGSWRVVFRAQGDVLEVVRVFHRRDGYGWLEANMEDEDEDDAGAA